MEIKDIKYWCLIILLNYIPTISLHYFVRPMWWKDMESHTSATIWEFSFTMFFLPIYLIFVNYLLAKKYNKLTELFFLNAMMMITCIIISTQLHLKNWSDSIGSVKPDGETQGVMNFACFVGVCICLLAFVIMYFNVKIKNKKLNHTDPVLK
jgi:uncharacterized membrane protein YciS (DUF1049 family)